MSIQQVSVFLENKSGALADMAAALGKKNINMRALSVAETNEFGIVRLVVDDAFAAATLLKEEGYIASITPVVGVSIDDEPGSLERVIKALNEAGLDVEYLYAFHGGQKHNQASIIMKVKDNYTAEAVLREAGMELLED